MTYVKYYLVSVNQSIFLSNHKPNQTKRLGLIIFQTEPHCCTWKTAHINLLWFDFVRGLAVFLNTLNEEFDPYVIWVTSYFWRNWFYLRYRTLIWCFGKWFYKYCKIYLVSQVWLIFWLSHCCGYLLFIEWELEVVCIALLQDRETALPMHSWNCILTLLCIQVEEISNFINLLVANYLSK